MLCINLACDRLDAAASPRPRALADTRTQPPACTGCETVANAAMTPKATPAITILRIMTIPQFCNEPRFRPTMQSFRRIAQQIPCRTNAPHHPHDFGVVSIWEPLVVDLSSNGAALNRVAELPRR